MRQKAGWSNIALFGNVMSATQLAQFLRISSQMMKAAVTTEKEADEKLHG